MSSNQPSIAGEAVIEAVENQLAENNPSKVRQTFDRLLSMGISRAEVVKYIACALSVEIFGALKNSETFNLARYQANLDSLPELPWEDETR